MSDSYGIPYGSGEQDYDITTLIAVDGSALQAAASALMTQAVTVGNGLAAINTAISGLQLGWAGATEQEAMDFVGRWNAVATALFGTGAANDDGVFNSADGLLNVLASGLQGVLDAFNQAETEVLKNFSSMFAALTPSTSDDVAVTSSDPNQSTGDDPVIVSS